MTMYLSFKNLIDENPQRTLWNVHLASEHSDEAIPVSISLPTGEYSLVQTSVSSPESESFYCALEPIESLATLCAVTRSGADTRLWYAPHLAGTLEQVLEQRGALSLEESLNCALALSGALEYLHSRGAAHGRLTADSVLLNLHGEPALIHALYAPDEQEPVSVQEQRAAEDARACAALLWKALTGVEPGATHERIPLPLHIDSQGERGEIERNEFIIELAHILESMLDAEQPQIRALSQLLQHMPSCLKPAPINAYSSAPEDIRSRLILESGVPAVKGKKRVGTGQRVPHRRLKSEGKKGRKPEKGSWAVLLSLVAVIALAGAVLSTRAVPMPWSLSPQSIAQSTDGSEQSLDSEAQSQAIIRRLLEERNRWLQVEGKETIRLADTTIIEQNRERIESVLIIESDYHASDEEIAREKLQVAEGKTRQRVHCVLLYENGSWRIHSINAIDWEK
ncbi:MAG: hypothetical protein Q4P78_03065 [Rothia sp. (in: high G+C Gram-positive bacteria)]|uniref:hypothetical protein n=1 Tax=Rothia sp. (in: high G+C Gram-positive bacteria) TaxID=1885016 RepID=UPI0026DF0D03|nr:hypothetical protein [Rothia sp. (in: high G+C Gram-positive bacteria)]MDO5750170.1 hypothetical protein [Rothia sp. (in: high G+C Gram-positive bacteria)]